MSEEAIPLNTSSTEEIYEYVDEAGKLLGYDFKNRLIIEDAVEEAIGGGGEAKVATPAPAKGPAKPAKPLTGFRMKIADCRPDGVLQDFLIRTEELFSFGPSESFDLDDPTKLAGYSLPLAVWDMDGATPSQKFFTDFLEVDLLNAVKEKLIEKKLTFKQRDLEIRDLRKMKIFHRKKDDVGDIDMNSKPTFYPKLIVNKKQGMKIKTPFYAMDLVTQKIEDDKVVTEPIRLNPMALLGQMGKAKAVIRIESIWIGTSGPSIQIKVRECDFKLSDNAMPRLAKMSLNATVVTDDNNPVSALMLGSKKPDSPKKQEIEAGGDIIPTGEDENRVAPVSKPTRPVREVKVIVPSKKAQ